MNGPDKECFSFLEQQPDTSVSCCCFFLITYNIKIPIVYKAVADCKIHIEKTTNLWYSKGN